MDIGGLEGTAGKTYEFGSSSTPYTNIVKYDVNKYQMVGSLKYAGHCHYDYQTIHQIINSVPVVHISFPTPDPKDPFPAMLPMIGFMGSYSNRNASLSEPLDLYLHGYISSRLMRLPTTNSTENDEGLPVTIGATHVDGIVLALTPNNHSYNYRSVVMHGYATPVTDLEEKVWAMKRITNGVVEGRWEHTRVPPNKTEMTSTQAYKSDQILRVLPVTASAKIRASPPSDDRADMKNDDLRAETWVGVVPTWLKYGEPVASGDNRIAKVPEHITSFISKQNSLRELNAKAAINGEPVGYDN
ncbi:hypothetical protein B7494_g7556 [Chlorociboria aeruginascens]|nr:hypothetical protein B7494_g7556 [Chlorociboria aeruginascens]